MFSILTVTFGAEVSNSDIKVKPATLHSGHVFIDQILVSYYCTKSTSDLFCHIVFNSDHCFQRIF